MKRPSGGAATALDGIAGLRKALASANERLSIMPGSGIAGDTVGPVLALGVREVHASCSEPIEMPAGRIAEFGFQSPSARRTDRQRVAALRAALP